MSTARSVEHLLTTHEIAQDRRAQGRPVWDRKIRIKDLLAQDAAPEGASSDERAAWVANRVAERLKRQLPAEWLEMGKQTDFTLLEVVDGMEALTASSYDDDDAFTAEEDCNNMLAALYDWADIKRVWVS